MSVERDKNQLRLDDRGFEGTQVVSLEDVKTSSWIGAGIDLLRSHHPVVAVGLATLIVQGIESCAVAAPWALIVVASMTTAFGVFVITIGCIHVQRTEASGPDDPGVACEGKGEVGETHTKSGKFARSCSTDCVDWAR